MPPENPDQDRNAADDGPESTGPSDALTFTHEESLRPGSAIAAGILGLGGGLALAVPSLLGPDPSWVLISGVALGLVLVWLYVVRPCVKLHDQGVRIVNPVSTIDLTWPVITDVQSRWTLELYAGDRKYAAWGVPAATNRPRFGRSIFQFGAGKLLSDERPENRPPQAKVEAATVAAEVQARIAADRERAGAPTPRVERQRWDVVPIGLLVAAVLFVIVALA